MTAQLELQGLTKLFGDSPEQALSALNASQLSKHELLEQTGHTLGVYNVNLNIAAGELFVVMGLSGCGKSTLVRLINRLIEPTAGRVLLDGQDVTALSARDLVALRRKKISMVFQSFALLPHRTVMENTLFGLEVAGVPKDEARQRAGETLEMVGVSQVADHMPDQLSGGMQQRVGLARAWVTNPDIMLMDEAFSALDPLIRTEMQDALLNLQRTEQRTIVFISHDLSEAVRIADRIAVMADAEIRQVGTPTDIIDNPADDYVRAFFRDVQPGRLFTAGDIASPGPVGSDIEPVPASALLESILPRAAAIDTPLPVADDKGQIIGSINRTQLLQALSRGRER
jgi:glycine betaine/proline transport system ATP-binding protein